MAVVASSAAPAMPASIPQSESLVVRSIAIHVLMAIIAPLVG
jgi:hypothetical protein